MFDMKSSIKCTFIYIHTYKCCATVHNVKFYHQNTCTVEPLYYKHFGTYFLLSFPLPEVKSVLTRLVGTKIFVLSMEVYSILYLIQGAC